MTEINGKNPHNKYLNEKEKTEIKNTLDQAADTFILWAWNESCMLFLDYIKTITFIPFKRVDRFFSGHKFQSTSGNVPHIHAMIRVMRKKLLEEVRQCTH